MGRFDTGKIKAWAKRGGQRQRRGPPSQVSASRKRAARPDLNAPPKSLAPEPGSTDGWKVHVSMQVPVVAPQGLLVAGLIVTLAIFAGGLAGLGAALAAVVALLYFLEPPKTIRKRPVTVDSYGIQVGRERWPAGTLRGAVWREGALYIRSAAGEDRAFVGVLDEEQADWLVAAIEQLARHNAKRRGTAADVPEDLHGMR